MLRNRDEEPAGRPDRSVQLSQNLLVFLDVLEDVERSDDVELLRVRKLPRVGLQQLGARRSKGGGREAGRKELAADKADLRKGGRDAAQHIARAAPDLEHRPRVREVRFERPEHEPVPSTEPKARYLGRREMFKRPLVEPVTGFGLASSEQADPVLFGGLISTRRALPPLSGKVPTTREAELHPSTASARPMPVAP